MKPDLETRIADAFGAQLSSKQIADLLAEVAQADADAKAASEAANEIALDPATRPDAVAQARKDMEDANFRRLRMERATERLKSLRAEAEQRESSERKQKEYSEAKAERDQLAKDLEDYEKHAAAIVPLLHRIVANNARIVRANGARQNAETWLYSAEMIARQADSGFEVRHDETLPKLAENVRLPKFRRDGTNIGYLWPQRNT